MTARKLIALVLALISFAVVGCSGTGSSTKEPASSSAKSSEPVTLRMMIWDKNQQPALETIAKEFQKTHSNITVNVEVTPWDQYWTKLQTAATGNTLPDVFWMNAMNFPLYAANKQLMSYADRVKADGVDMSKYPKDLVETYSYNGQVYGLPKDFDTIGLWYNKQLFDAAKLPYPDDTWDWAKLREVAKKLTDTSKGIWGIAAELGDQTSIWNTIYQNGGYVLSPDKATSGYDKPETVAGIQFWVDLIKDGSSPTLAQMTDTAPAQLFESGKVAMYFAGSWMVREFKENEYTKDKVNVTVLPKGKKRAVMIHGLGNVTAAKTKHPNEAWEFVKYLGGKEAAEIQAKTGTVIPAYTGTQDMWVQSAPQFNLKVFLDMAQYGVALPATMNSEKWRTAHVTYFTKAWAGEITVEEAAKNVAKAMNEVLAKK